MLNVRQIKKYPIVGFFLYLIDFISAALYPKKEIDKYIRTCHIYFVYTEMISCAEEHYFEQPTLEGFYGYLLTEFNFSLPTAETYFRSACQLPRFLNKPELEYHLKSSDEYRKYAKQLYGALEKNRSLLTYYEAWPLRSQDGHILYLNLVQFQKQYGKKHCSHWHRQLSKHARTIPKNTLVSLGGKLHTILNLLYQVYPNAEYLETLSDPLEVNESFEEMHEIHSVEYLDKNPSWSPSVFRRRWYQIEYAYRTAIIGSELVAEPLYDLYVGDSKDVLSNKLGSKVTKLISLLTPLPEHLSDSKTADLVFSKIKSDIETLTECCETECARILAGFNERMRASEIGVAGDVDHPSAQRHLYENRCATWQKHGYNLDSCAPHFVKMRRRLFGTDKSLNEELMLLTTRSLLPFIYLLIVEHPFITTSWLLEFELYDKHGRVSNFLNEGRVVLSYKRRRGTTHAQQECHLTPKSKKLFEDILAITSQAREFLRVAGDDQYRFLLIGSTGVSRPSKFEKIPQLFNAANDDKFLNILIDRLGLDIAKRINPKSIRSTAAVRVYIDTGRLRAMSEALGHLRFNQKLLSYYLPKEIMIFFLNRWVRIFQTAITYQAVRGRPCMDVVMGAKTMKDIDAFFENHGLKPLPAYLELGTHGLPQELDEVVQNTQIVIPITPELCDVLVTMGKVIRDLDHQNIMICKEALTWKQTVLFVEKTVALHKEKQLRTCSAGVINIFSSAKVVPSMARKLSQLIASR